jgi:LmbE family N-acetylglucosaminyl deacetylase
VRALVVAPHPDDEILGAGGVISRLSQTGHDVEVVVVTSGQPPLFTESYVQRVQDEARQAHRTLGVKESIFLEGFPAAGLDALPSHRLNHALTEVVTTRAPDWLFLPFAGDIHRDHQIVFTSALVAARPSGPHRVRAIYAYETLSETNWHAPPITPGFHPNIFFDVTDFLPAKLEAMECYASQLKPFPNERSLEAVKALARYRGATVGVEAAEAFVLVRQVVPEEDGILRT